MLYPKNVPTWERAVRVLAGTALIACGLIGLKGLLPGYLLALTGVVAVLTGFMGFCPLCALAGRKIKASLQEKPTRK